MSKMWQQAGIRGVLHPKRMGRFPALCDLLVYLGSGHRREQKAAPGETGLYWPAALEPHPAAE